MKYRSKVAGSRRMHRLQNNFCIRCIAPLIGEIVRGQFPWEGLFQERGRLLEGRGHPCCLHSLSQKLRKIWGHQEHQERQEHQGNQGRQEELGQEETTSHHCTGFLGSRGEEAPRTSIRYSCLDFFKGLHVECCLLGPVF